MIEGVQRHGSFLLGLQDPVGGQLVERVMGFFQLAVRAPAPHRVAAAAIEQDVGRSLENEAGEVGHLAALSAVVQPQENFLNQVVDFVSVGATPKESA